MEGGYENYRKGRGGRAVCRLIGTITLNWEKMLG
jgi:hypothetical protein